MAQTKVKPWNTELWTDSIESLRLTAPTVQGHTIEVAAYTLGGLLGGGFFIYDQTDLTSADNGGTIIVTSTGQRWKRKGTPDSFDVTHFGAVMDGVTDDMPAVIRMHNWSRTIDATYGPGIVLPAGRIALSTFNTGTSEIQSFKLTGPYCEFGMNPRVSIVPVNKTTTTPMFTTVARRAEVTGIRLNFAGSVLPFFKNNVSRGSYLRVKCVLANSCGARVFSVQDTIDTKLDQVYSFDSTGAFFYTGWTSQNPGNWDHSTAVELSNFNFNGTKGEAAVLAIRCGQSHMNNGWFDHCYQGFDISQGGWILNGVIQENSTIASAVKYAKLVETACRYSDGPGISYDLSGYLPSMDPSGTIPTWVTNAMDQGRVSLETDGVIIDAGLSSEFNFSQQVITNGTAQEQWVYLGRLYTQALGRSWKLRLIGGAGWDGTGDNTNDPTGTNYAGGEAIIFGQLKADDIANSGLGMVHWHGEGSCPIVDVMFKHEWQTIGIYVKMGKYTKMMGTFIESNGVPRRGSGSPFYFRDDGSIMTEAQVLAVANIKKASARWNVNNGVYHGAGFGMDFDSKRLNYWGAAGASSGVNYLPIDFNGNPRLIRLDEQGGSLRVNVYDRADLPSPATHVRGLVLCSDIGAGSGAGTQMRLLFSDGLSWIYSDSNEKI